MSSSKETNLTATYTSPTSEPFAISKSIAAGTSSSSPIAAKTHFLSTLREAVTATQEQVNKELTARMEEDKARLEAAAASNGGGDAVAAKKKAEADGAKEEENYGEEVQEDDD